MNVINCILKSKFINSESNYPDYNKLYTVKEVEIKSHDGVMVPLSIIYPKNMHLIRWNKQIKI